MKRKRTLRTSKPQTIRLDPDAQRIVDLHTTATGWSQTKAVNELIHFAFFSGKGDAKWVEAWRAMCTAAAVEHAAEVAAAVRVAAAAAERRAAARSLRSPHTAELQL